MHTRTTIVLMVLFAVACTAQEPAAIAELRRDWNNATPLSSKKISIASLPISQRTAIAAAIKRWTHQISGSTDDEHHADEFTITTLHLGEGGNKQIVAIATGQFYCSPTGNCSMYVLQAFEARYRVILESIGQTFSLLPNRTKGYRDILITMHGSATLSGLKIYRFDGSRYKRAGCYNAEFEILDKDGKVKKREKPRITPCSH